MSPKSPTVVPITISDLFGSIPLLAAAVVVVELAVVVVELAVVVVVVLVVVLACAVVSVLLSGLLQPTRAIPATPTVANSCAIWLDKCVNFIPSSKNEKINGQNNQLTLTYS